MFKIKEVKDKNIWERFVLAQKEKTFLHSWNWGEFHKSLESKIFRFGVYDNAGELDAVFMAISVKAKRGKFLFVPHGPVFGKNFHFSIFNFQFLVNYLKALAAAENCDFIRISPVLENDDKYLKVFNGLGFRRAPIHMHAELIWLLDLSLTEDELLRNMRKTTRYSIKKAERESVKIIKSSDSQDVSIFNRIYGATASRQQFVPYSENYLQKEFDAFAEDNQALIFMAEYKGEIISGAIDIFYDGEAVYHQGASSLKYPQVPASYLLQWEAIKEAKRRGCRFYNFWGIAPIVENCKLKIENSKRHPWAGLTMFKKGFGGFSKEYLPAQDLVLKPFYWVNYIIEKIRKITRNL